MQQAHVCFGPEADIRSGAQETEQHKIRDTGVIVF
jgi:hypothetical protein